MVFVSKEKAGKESQCRDHKRNTECDDRTTNIASLETPVKVGITKRLQDKEHENERCEFKKLLVVMRASVKLIFVFEIVDFDLGIVLLNEHIGVWLALSLQSIF